MFVAHNFERDAKTNIAKGTQHDNNRSNTTAVKSTMNPNPSLDTQRLKNISGLHGSRSNMWHTSLLHREKR